MARFNDKRVVTAFGGGNSSQPLVGRGEQTDLGFFPGVLLAASAIARFGSAFFSTRLADYFVGNGCRGFVVKATAPDKRAEYRHLYSLVMRASAGECGAVDSVNGFQAEAKANHGSIVQTSKRLRCRLTCHADLVTPSCSIRRTTSCRFAG